jgi:hypothetical protein
MICQKSSEMLGGFKQYRRLENDRCNGSSTVFYTS